MGPSPPVISSTPARRGLSAEADDARSSSSQLLRIVEAIACTSSPTVTCAMVQMPIPASPRASHAELVLIEMPEASSSPTERMMAFMAGYYDRSPAERHFPKLLWPGVV